MIVETDRSWLQAGNRRLPITPGMMCDVDIITGCRKSILNYLLNPVLTAWNEGLRERQGRFQGAAREAGGDRIRSASTGKPCTQRPAAE